MMLRYLICSYLCTKHRIHSVIAEMFWNSQISCVLFTFVNVIIFVTVKNNLF